MPKTPREPEPLGIGCYVTDLELGIPAPVAKPEDRTDVQPEPRDSEIPDDVADNANS